MPESSTLRVIITCSFPARSLTSAYPSSSPSYDPFSSHSSVQPHPPRSPRCLTPYPHNIAFRSPSPFLTPRPFPPSSLSSSPSPLPSPSALQSAYPYASSSFPYSPSLSQSMSPLLSQSSPYPETTHQLDERDYGSERGMKTRRDKYSSVCFLLLLYLYFFRSIPSFMFDTIANCLTRMLIPFLHLHPP